MPQKRVEAVHARAWKHPTSLALQLQQALWRDVLHLVLLDPVSLLSGSKNLGREWTPDVRASVSLMARLNG